MKGTAAPSAVRWVGVSRSRFVSARGLSHGRGPCTRHGTAPLAAVPRRPAHAVGRCPGPPTSGESPGSAGVPPLAPLPWDAGRPESLGPGSPARPRERLGVPIGGLGSGPHRQCQPWLLLLST